MKRSTVAQQFRHTPSSAKAHQPISAAQAASGNTSLSARLDDLKQITSELITPYMTMSIEQIDSEISGSIQRIVELLNIERGFLAQYSVAKKRMVCTHCYEASVSKHAVICSNITVPAWVLNKMLRRECVNFSHVEDLPEEAKQDRAYFKSVGTQSHISIPLEIDGEVIGCLSMESTGSGIAWPETVFRTLKPMADVFALSLQRKRKKLEISEKMRFETLLADLSARFVKLDPAEVDEQINQAFEMLGKLFSLDRCGLLEFQPHDKSVIITHVWYNEGKQRIPDATNLALIFPWSYERLFVHGECVLISSLADLPPDAERDRETYTAMGVRSSLSIPLFVGRKIHHVISFNTMDVERQWPEEYVPRLRLIGEVLINALMRKQAYLERKARQSELTERVRFENLLADISARFIKMTPEEVDAAIEHGLEMIGEFFHGDRTALLEAHTDEMYVKVTHAWYAEGLKRVSKDINLAPLFPWSYERLVMLGQVIKLSNLKEYPPAAEKDRQSDEAMGVRSKLNIPLAIGKKIRHIIVFNDMKTERSWPEEYVPRLRLIGEVFINALARKRADMELRRSYEEIRELKDTLQVEADLLRSEIRSCKNREEIIGRSEALSKVMIQVEQVAPTDSTVLICGETGTGKELIAQAIHDMSLYRDKIMVKVNCASLPATLVESELFGREKGAYTGALTRQIGRFEMADGSTIFLDEIAELPLELQSKLLRVLQENTFERLGSPKTIKVHVRVIAATNRNIREEVKNGKFREDLFYRLNVFPITVPPLRDRIEDIPMLVWAFVNEFCEKMGKQLYKIAKRDMEALQRYPWPGNIRELRNIIEHAVIVSNNGTLQIKLPQGAQMENDWAKSLEEVETQHIQAVLRHTGGRIKGEGGAASILGMIPSTLNSRMKKLGIRLRHEKGEISS